MQRYLSSPLNVLVPSYAAKRTLWYPAELLASGWLAFLRRAERNG